MSWFDTYPHEIWVSVILKDNKIAEWKVGENTLKEKYFIPSDFGYEEKCFIANSSEEHNNIFETESIKWLRQWKLHEEFKGNSPFIEPKPILDDDVYTLDDINKIEDDIKSCENYPNCNAFQYDIKPGQIICSSSNMCCLKMKYIRTIKKILNEAKEIIDTIRKDN